MESNRLADFVVNSKEHCFFCLEKVSNTELATGWTSLTKEPDEDSLSSRSSRQTIHYLSRYLKLDMTKVFNQKGSIPPSLLAKVKRARLKTNICQDCACLTNSFSVLYRQWEKLSLEMESKLSKIEEKMRKAEKLKMSEQLRRLWGEDDGLMDVLEALRLEAMGKLFGQVGKPLPQVIIRNLTSKKIRAHLRISRGNQSRETPITELGFQSNSDIKMESQKEDLNRDDDDTGNDFLDDIGSVGGGIDDDDAPMTESGKVAELATGMPLPNVTSVSTKQENCETTSVNFALSASKKAEKGNYTVDPKTGKYKCNLCLKELQEATGFNRHYQSIHLKIRYKCNICGKILSRKPNYNRHLRSAHLGVRFKCLNCNQQFTTKQNLQLHQRKNNCKLEGQR